MKMATVYLRRGRIFVHASSRTTEGVWISSEPYETLAITCSDEELGAIAKVALENSRGGVPHPRDWKTLLEKFLQQAGVKSWSTFVKGATCADIKDNGEHITVTPMKNLGPKEGFLAEESKKVIVERNSNSAVGAVVRGVLAPSSREHT
jgi:hypothetical protein